ncbi:MAG: ester cyclase [Planctomycetota bacterium]
MSNGRAMLEMYYAAWCSGDPDAVAAFFENDAVFEDLAFGARFEGLDGVRTFAQITFAGVPDFHITPTQILVDGEQAAAAWTMTGTFAADMAGIPATGQPFEIRASSIIALRAGRILRMTDYWNPAALLPSG